MAHNFRINYIPHINGRYISKAKWQPQRKAISEHYANDKATENHMLQLLIGIQPQASASTSADITDSTASVHMDTDDATPVDIVTVSTTVDVTSQQDVRQTPQQEGDTQQVQQETQIPLWTPIQQHQAMDELEEQLADDEMMEQESERALAEKLIPYWWHGPRDIGIFSGSLQNLIVTRMGWNPIESRSYSIDPGPHIDTESLIRLRNMIPPHLRVIFIGNGFDVFHKPESEASPVEIIGFRDAEPWEQEVLKAIENKELQHTPWDITLLEQLIEHQAKWNFDHKPISDTEQQQLRDLQMITITCAKQETDKYKALYETSVELERG